MYRARLLWRFVRADAVARWLGVATVFVAWFATTLLSLGVAALLPVPAAAFWWRYRMVGAAVVEDDLDDLL